MQPVVLCIIQDCIEVFMEFKKGINPSIKRQVIKISKTFTLMPYFR